MEGDGNPELNGAGFHTLQRCLFLLQSCSVHQARRRKSNYESFPSELFLCAVGLLKISKPENGNPACPTFSTSQLDFSSESKNETGCLCLLKDTICDELGLKFESLPVLSTEVGPRGLRNDGTCFVMGSFYCSLSPPPSSCLSLVPESLSVCMGVVREGFDKIG